MQHRYHQIGVGELDKFKSAAHQHYTYQVKSCCVVSLTTESSTHELYTVGHTSDYRAHKDV